MSGLRVILSRCSALFRRPALDRELDDELRAHLEMAAEEHRRRGMSAEEARQAALREFGGVTQVRETVRLREGWPLLENLRRDIGYALRQMRRAPGFTTVVLLTLALGIGATTTIFTVVYSTLLRSLPYPQADRLLALHDARLHGASTGGLMSVPRFFDLKARNKSFASLGFFFFDQATLIDGTHLPVAVKAAGVNADFWKVFEVAPLLGRTFTSADDAKNAPETVVLSYSGWQKIFGGDRSVIQRQISLDRSGATIVGVMPPDFSAPAGVDLWHSARFAAGDWSTYRGEGTRFINVVARLRKGVTAAMAQGDLERIGQQLRHEHADSDGMWQFSSETLRENRYGAMRPALSVLLLAAALLLVIACINVANLFLSRATARQREVALRRALGASARRIVAQFLIESTLLALVGGGLGVLAAWALIHSVIGHLPGRLGLPGTVLMQWPIVAFAFAIAALTGAAFGIAPAREGRRVELHTTLKQGETRIGGSGHQLRNVLIAVQVGLSLMLVVGATLLAESLWHLMNNPLGFQPDHVLTFYVGLPWDTKEPQVRNFFDTLQQRLEHLPGVAAVGQMDALPTVDWHLRSNFDADWLPRIANKPAISAEDRNIGGNFLRAMGVPLLAGRAFTDEDSRMKQIPILVNEALVRAYLPGGNPLGRHLIVGGDPHEIVGVLANIRGTAGEIAAPPGPEVYWPADGDAGVTHRSFVIRSSIAPDALIPVVRDTVHAIDPTLAMGEPATMDALLDKAVAQPRLNMAVVAAFALIALLLACVGIYGVVAFFVSQRTQEIGVRMAMGASRQEVGLLFVRRALTTAALGLAGGTAAALALTRLIASQLYGVRAGDPLVYAASVLALLVPVVLATLQPAWRAASVNPVEALRSE
jgi:putative ABC transport system permease protein